MKNPNARFIVTPAPTNNPLPLIKTCASCVYSEPSGFDPSEIVCEIWQQLRIKLENGCTAFFADQESYYSF